MTRLNFTLSDALPSLPKTGMPVTIITGFLGSGKTTLLNQILQNKDNLKVAVLVNEFGDINIDEQLLISMESDMVELDNGCICCTINNSLVEAVYQVLEREEKVDCLVIETTGLADPLPIILTFLSTELEFLTRLDAVITVVDAAAFDAKHFESDAAFSQIRYGDMVILNKIDLATKDQIKELEAFIGDVKPGFRILQSEYGRVPLPLILDIGLNQEDHYQEQISEFRRDRSSFNHHLENDDFSFVSFQSDRLFELEKFIYFLTKKLSNKVFRAKGILWF
jgi:G3E family GTPase